MSILLDALRKSEEQRRLGATPSIHGGPATPGPGGESGQQWIPFVLIALAAVAMAWFGWQQYRQPADAAMPEMAVAEEQDANPEVRTPQFGPGPDADGKTAPDRGAARPGTPVESFAAEARPPQAHAGPPETAQRERVGESIRSFGGEDEQQDAAQPPEPQAEADVTTPDVVLEPPPAGRRDADAQARSSRPDREPPTSTEPITFWELPQGVRDSLPELRITVLVYAEAPEDRFLLMNGQRLVEKDEVDSGLVLDEIRRDGAVFLYRSYRFLVQG